MDSLLIVDLNSCCNSLLKLKYWLILAKYGASKLELIKQITLDAALDDFECRSRLECRFKQTPVDRFIEFASDAYRKVAKSVSDFIRAPDWTIFDENGDFIRPLEMIIRNEIEAISALMTYESHFGCLETFHNLRDEILCIVNSWSEVPYVYTTYTSASLSAIFTKRMTALIDEYENHPASGNARKLLAEITGVKTDGGEREPDDGGGGGGAPFWFVSQLLNLHWIEESPNLDDLYDLRADDDASTSLAAWIWNECANEFRAFTRRVWRHPTGEVVERLDTETLNASLNISVEDVEVNLNGTRLSDGPHYLIEPRALTEMQTTTEAELSRMSLENDAHDRADFDFIDSILQESGDTQFNVFVSHIKDELNESFTKDFTNIKREFGDCGGAAADSQLSASIESGGDGVAATLKKTIESEDAKYAKTQHKKRGRPKKLDEYNQTAPKHGQHKYSPENVLDCSTWISDNFYDVPGNKPAIDRARLYELYTNYCTLKFCTPVDRALFGKIIRKVFPQLKSRRLIQNQVLKYHYVGLQPKHTELEQALLYANSSINPQEIMVSYVPVEE